MVKKVKAKDVSQSGNPDCEHQPRRIVHTSAVMSAPNLLCAPWQLRAIQSGPKE